MNDLINVIEASKPQAYSINSNLLKLTDTKKMTISLNEKEQLKIYNAFNAKYYDMAAEYIWIRSMNILRDKIAVFGNDFIADMLGYDNFSSVKDISEELIIGLCADIGMIKQTARIKLKSTSELLYHLQRRQAVEEENEELGKSDALNVITICINYVLNNEEDTVFIPYANMRKDLQTRLLEENSELLSSLLNSPYFYIRTITRTMINLASDEKNPSLDITLQNLILVLKHVWGKLDENERWYIGIAYSQAVSAGNSQLTRAIRTVLNSVKGFDYVPESTKSDTYRKTARHLLAKHNDFNNFYTEPELARLLLNMGTSIPKAALIECLTAVLICRLGNSYGVSNAAILYLDSILDTVSNDSWAYFLNELKTNTEVLFELAFVQRDDEVLKIWANIIRKYSLNGLSLNDQNVKKLITDSVASNFTTVRNIAEKLYSNNYKI